VCRDQAYLWNTSGATNKDDIVNLGLLHIRILEHLLHGLEGLLEEIYVELLKLGAGERLGQVHALEEGLDFNARGHLRRKGTLCLFGLALQLAHRLLVGGDVDVVLLVELLREATEWVSRMRGSAWCEGYSLVDNALVEVLTTKAGITSGSQNLEDTLVN
jgi:hypothetical protein